jgi:hypothetical protein
VHGYFLATFLLEAVNNIKNRQSTFELIDKICAALQALKNTEEH